MATQAVRETDGYQRARNAVVEMVSDHESICPTTVNDRLETLTDDQVREAIWDLIDEGQIRLDYDLSLVMPSNFDQRV